MAQIRVKEVEGPVSKGNWSVVTVVYDDKNGDEKNKQLVSFKNEDVYKLFLKAKAGEAYEVTNEKDGKYWQWVSAKKLNAEEAAAAKEERSNKYERDAKVQVSIVRQTCLKAAGAVYTGRDCSAVDVIDMARAFERYVNEDFVEIEPDITHDRGEIV